MNGNDIPPFRPQFSDLASVVGLLTRIPLPAAAFMHSGTRPAAFASWAYPLVGVVTGGLAAALGALALGLGLPAPVAALILLLTSFVATGAMHEDGLADCADGFWGGWTPERRLEIMKDSQIGTYGVLALVTFVGLRWAALSALMEAGPWVLPLIVAAVASRGTMVWVMWALPNARSGGLSSLTGRPPQSAAWIASGCAAIALVLLPGGTGLLAIVALVLTALAAGMIARSKIGGQTGDVLGATQQIGESAVLLVCVAAL